ncbi:MAG TPA: trypsin-like peptidase domain-containing protein [Candidatus Scatomorpha gallistercoris]|nr:trypsin-like peptidase domain-containing protein [Candidatus Scatomorpha gallistercoris]
MYPYDENDNLNNENTESSGNSSVPSDDGSYRMVKPDAGKSFDAAQDESSNHDPGYRDANYTSEGEGASTPNFYSPSARRKEPKQKKQRRGMPAAAIVALCLVCALVGGGFGGVIAGSLNGDDAQPQTTLNQENTPTTTGSSVSNNSSGEMSARDIYYNLALKQVVGINSDITTTNVWGMQVQGSVSGTGFVISEDGYILTNYHVIEDAYNTNSPITVMFSSESGYDTTEYTAEVIGFERNNDVAIIKIDATGLSAATLGSSSDLLVGDTVYAVGNPLGELTYSMTPGIVSATDRVITTEEGRMNMFQISAAVNEGNSGGPVYNAYGQVVGIVTAKPNTSSSGTSTEGIGFAIPIDDAVRIADEVINGGHQVGSNDNPAYLGITAQDVDTMAQQYYNMPMGAYVLSVTDGSAADNAGILVGDIITQVDGYDVQSRDDLAQELTFHSAGETCEVVVYRSGEYQTLSVTFDSVPETDTSTSPTGYFFPAA